MLGVGLEAVGYSSVRSESHAAVAASVAMDVTASPTRTMFLQDVIKNNVQASCTAFNQRITPMPSVRASGETLAVVNGVIFKIGNVIADCSARVIAGVKVNGYYPAPPWRRHVVDPFFGVVVVDHDPREMVV